MRTVHLLAVGSPAAMFVSCRPGSSSPSYVQIAGVPDDTPDEEVIKQANKVILWPWPRLPVAWGKITGLPEGAIVRC